MEIPVIQAVRRLAEVRAPECVTVYAEAQSWLRGNHVTSAAASQLRAVTDKLESDGVEPSKVAAIRAQFEHVMTNRRAEHLSTEPRVKSVAMFVTPDICEVFVLTTAPAPWVSVTDRFLVGPLMQAALALVPPVYVLAASENRVRLVDVTALPAASVPVSELPRDLNSTLRLDLTGDRDTLAHLRTSEDPKERLHEFARAIWATVAAPVTAAGAVVSIAAAEPFLSILEASAPAHLPLISTIPGNQDESSVDRLAELAALVAEQHQARILDAQLSRLSDASELALRDYSPIWWALGEGAVDRLFLDTDWRDSIAGDNTSDPAQDAGDALLRAALATGATVVPLSPQASGEIGHYAALLRYPIET